MAEVIAPLRQDKKLIEYLVPGVNKVAIVFWHGLGDCVQFMSLLKKIRDYNLNITVDIMLQKGLGQEVLYPNAIMIDTLDGLEDMDYDYIFLIHFPVEQDPDLTKLELCNKLEIGFPNYTSIYTRVLPTNRSKLVGIHFQNTAMPDTFNVPYDVAKKIWEETIASGYIPIELTFQHVFHNPVNKRYDFIGSSARGCIPQVETLLSLIDKCCAVLAVPSGPLHCALAMKQAYDVLYLQKEIPINRFTHSSINSINVMNYEDGSVKAWLERRAG